MTVNWKPTQNQIQRSLRSRAVLEERRVPMWGDATRSLHVEDDAQAQTESAQNVARRTLVLWAVDMRAEGIPQHESLKIIEAQDLWTAVSPKERAFLLDPELDPELAQPLVWRLEAIWVLLWAQGHVSDLPWPSGMCDVQRIVDVISPREVDPSFVQDARLVPKEDLLDAQDLTMKIHWAIRDAYLNGREIPEDLDWRSKSRKPVELCPAIAVVEQRHLALNWVLRFMDPRNWDMVDTPT